VPEKGARRTAPLNVPLVNECGTVQNNASIWTGLITSLSANFGRQSCVRHLWCLSVVRVMKERLLEINLEQMAYRAYVLKV
jgi:hypothetical protein